MGFAGEVILLSRFLEAEELNRSGDKTRAESSCLAARWVFRLVAASLGMAQIIAARNTIGPDARSYLEIARAILRHDWAMTVNAYWSPAFSWLLAGGIALVRPTLRGEFPLAHFLAFPVWLACIAAFEFFWVALLRFGNRTADRITGTGISLTPLQMWTLGYSFFIWLAVGGLMTAINPDLLMTAVVLLAAGMLLRIAMADASRLMFACYGICLGFGYLAKAILFPMGLVFLTVMILIALYRGKFARQKLSMALPVLLFLIIAAPQIALLSHAKGRLTFSDTGKLAYAWYTYGLPLRNWQGLPAGSGRPTHPTLKVNERPAVYTFNGPVRSSYPPWFDPSYWNEGLSPKLQLGVVERHVLHDVSLVGLVLLQPTAWAVLILFLLIASDTRNTVRCIALLWYLIAIAGVATALHCLTLVEGRYLAPWELLFWGSILVGVRLRRTNGSWLSLTTSAFTVIVCVALLGAIAHLVYGEVIHGFHNDASAEYVTAEGLQKMGLQPGQKIGAIGFDNDAYWAYLSGVGIVAEIDTDDTCLFWSESAAAQNEILEKFAQAGATVVVANTGGAIHSTSAPVPVDLATCAQPGEGWRKVEGSPNHAYFLQ